MDTSIEGSIKRMLAIWNERQVYPSSFLERVKLPGSDFPSFHPPTATVTPSSKPAIVVPSVSTNSNSFGAIIAATNEHALSAALRDVDDAQTASDLIHDEATKLTLANVQFDGIEFAGALRSFRCDICVRLLVQTKDS
jgi:hypothetical protein